MRKNSKRYIRLHNWYYLNRDKASQERVDLNIKLRQLILRECLKDALEGEQLSRTLILAIKEGLDDALAGHYNKLFSPTLYGQGSQKKHPTDITMIGQAVRYVSLCKQGALTRKNHINFVKECFGVSRETIRGWYKDETYSGQKDSPIPFRSENDAEETMKTYGEIYRNNKKGRKKE